MTQGSNRFNQIPQAEIQRSSFNRSHGLKTTLDAGDLVPIFVDEVLPGDTHNLKMAAFGRMSTPIHPVMDNIYMETFFFFVPNRLIWDNWQRFNGEQDNPGDSIDFTVPTYTFSNPISENSLADHFGLPLGPSPTTVNVLPFRAYNLIWNEFFRDQNLQDSIQVNTGDGGDVGGAIATPRKRGKRHDYFTSCLPFPQKGETVLLPLGTSAPIQSSETVTSDLEIFDSAGTRRNMIIGTSSNLQMDATSTPTVPGLGELTADLTNATSATINELRQAFQIQRMQERDARGGTRYVEILKAHFGVSSPDQRLQRPEYLGGGQSMVNINPVAQTQATVFDGSGGGIDQAATPQANLAAYGTVSAQNHGFTKSFVEHGYIIGMVSFRADLTYQQGIDRMWSRQTRYDYFWPALAHLGEQAVLNKEIFYQGAPADEEVFGYQERFAEYRFKNSTITGAFRSTAAAPLDAWHLAQDFDNLPVLGDTFIQENPPIDRVLAVPTEPQFILDCYFNYNSARPMPVYGVPGMIDHF